MDRFDLPAVQGTLKSLLQHHSSKASILRRSAFFIAQLSHPYKTTGKTIALTRQTFVGIAVFLNGIAFSIIQQMFSIWSLALLPFLNPAWTPGNSWFTLMLKPSMWDFKHDLTSMGDECNCLMVSPFFGTTLLGYWDEDWPYLVLWLLPGVPDSLT